MFTELASEFIRNADRIGRLREADIEVDVDEAECDECGGYRMDCDCDTGDDDDFVNA